MNDIYKIKDRLKTALENSSMSAAELARRSNINKSNICRYLKGSIIPKPYAVHAMAEALNVTPTWLFGYGDDSSAGSSNSLDLSKLTPYNQAKVVGYYQALLDTQDHPESTFTYEEIPK